MNVNKFRKSKSKFPVKLRIFQAEIFYSYLCKMGKPNISIFLFVVKKYLPRALIELFFLYKILYLLI